MKRQHQGMDRPGVLQVPEGSGEQRKMKETGCEITCGAPTTLVVKGLVMMMMFIEVIRFQSVVIVVCVIFCSLVCLFFLYSNETTYARLVFVRTLLVVSYSSRTNIFFLSVTVLVEEMLVVLLL